MDDFSTLRRKLDSLNWSFICVPSQFIQQPVIFQADHRLQTRLQLWVSLTVASLRKFRLCTSCGTIFIPVFPTAILLRAGNLSSIWASGATLVRCSITVSTCLLFQLYSFRLRACKIGWMQCGFGMHGLFFHSGSCPFSLRDECARLN